MSTELVVVLTKDDDVVVVLIKGDDVVVVLAKDSMVVSEERGGDVLELLFNEEIHSPAEHTPLG